MENKTSTHAFPLGPALPAGADFALSPRYSTNRVRVARKYDQGLFFVHNSGTDRSLCWRTSMSMVEACRSTCSSRSSTSSVAVESRWTTTGELREVNLAAIGGGLEKGLGIVQIARGLSCFCIITLVSSDLPELRFWGSFCMPVVAKLKLGVRSVSVSRIRDRAFSLCTVESNVSHEAFSAYFPMFLYSSGLET